MLNIAFHISGLVQLWFALASVRIVAGLLFQRPLLRQLSLIIACLPIPSLFHGNKRGSSGLNSKLSDL